jgi:hypothetical protein
MPDLIFNEGDTANLRLMVREFMPDTVTITDPGDITEDPDTGATIIGSPTTRTTVGNLTSTGTAQTLQEFGGQLTADADFLLTIPSDVTLTEGHEITVNGVEYTIVAVARAGTWDATTRALVTEGRTVGG